MLAVLLQDENLVFSEEHLSDIRHQSAKMSHRGQMHLYHDKQIAISHHSHHRIPNQPYRFLKDRYTLVFNGAITNSFEIYNYLLSEGFTCKEKTDVEIIANLFLHKKTKSFAMLQGSFVLLIWDREEKVLIGARDRFGIKQLYYMESPEETIFATEKKSTLFPHYEEQLDDYAFHHYLDYQYIPEPHTLTKGIKQTKKGHYFIKKLNEPIQFIRYFDSTFTYSPTPRNDLIKEGRDSLHQAVFSRLVNHDKNGIYTQSNLASFALAQITKKYDENIKLFSVHAYEECSFINKMAEELAIKHIPVHITADQFMEKLPEIIWLLDDPFADTSKVAHYFVSKQAKDSVESLISPIGSEEVLGNYLPKSSSVLSQVKRILPPFLRQKNEQQDWCNPQFSNTLKQRLLKRIIRVQSDQKRLINKVKEADEITQRQYTQLTGELPSNQLRQLEMLLTANQIALQTPFLDEKLFSVLRKLTYNQKRKNELLMSVVFERFSQQKINEFRHQNKIFEVIPLSTWLRNECYDWVKQIVLASDIDYLISKQEVIKMLKNHKEQPKENVQPLWTIIVFIIWHLIYVEDYYSFRMTGREQEVFI